jgi:hypothetical protein
MSKLSLCILDDKIPVEKLKDLGETINDTSYIDENLLSLCLSLFNDDEWDDVDLRNFVSEIKTDDTFTISGFKSHTFFFNHKEEILFSPDIIVFDWDTGDGTDSSDNLLKLLNSTYCLVAVFTGADTEDEVTSELAKEIFKEFQHRLFLVKKNENNSVQQLKDSIESKKKHFSFQYGNELKLKTERALSEVLSSIGKLSYEELISLFGIHIKQDDKSRLYELDFIEIILDRMKAVLISSGYDNIIDVPHTNINDEQTVRKIWYFRLYQKPNDFFVRKGDIIELQDSDLKYLVLSSDCHLDKFWQKNLGHITLIPIYRLNNSVIINKIKNYNKENVKQFSISSLINPRGLENITILPGVFFNNEENSYIDGILCPKEILSIEIPIPAGSEPKQHLKYDNSRIIGNERIQLVEPFLSPLIHFILKTITDVGVPDFGHELQDDLKKKIRAL